MLEQLPPEILARIFEIGILAWGISYLPPLCLVCTACNDVVLTEPRLWGIISMNKNAVSSFLEMQLSKAKAAPLTIDIQRKAPFAKLGTVLQRLASLSENWVYADVPVNVLALCTVSGVSRSLLDLNLRSASSGDDHSYGHSFFGTSDGQNQATHFKLRTFRATGLEKAWIIPFLSPQLVRLELCRLGGQSQLLSDIFKYLRMAPNIFALKLEMIQYSIMDIATPPVHLPNLVNFELVKVQFPGRILTKIRAPALTTLAISDSLRSRTQGEGLGTFFAEWFQERSLPANLHTLELANTLDKSSVPYLIRWLSRLKHLVRLTLRDDELGNTAQVSNASNIFKSLAVPSEEYDGWLCPSLAELRLDTGEMSVKGELKPIAEARGSLARQYPTLETMSEALFPPCRLRLLEAPLCPNAFEPEIEDIKGVSPVVVCGCMGCSMSNLSLDLDLQ